MSDEAVACRIAVGVDASREASAALKWALQLGAAVRASLFVVHGEGLLEGAGFGPKLDVAGLVRAAREASSTPAAEQPPLLAVVRPGPGAEALLAVAGEYDVDLLVVGRRGAGDTARLLGSTSEHVLAHASVPVVIVPTAMQPSASVER